MNLRISPLRTKLFCALLCSSLQAAAQLSFQPPQQATTFTTLGNAAAVGDFNGDGKLDLIVNFDYSATVLLGNGDGTFLTAGATLLYPVFAVGDFDGDGKPDVLCQQSRNGSTTWWIGFGNGDGTFQLPVNSNIGNVGVAGIADLNGDGKSDLVGLSGSNFYALLSNGNGGFDAGPLYSYTAPNNFVLADFNGDGKIDIAFAGAGAAAVMLGNGNGTFQSIVNSPGIGVPVASADLNGDGYVDLVVADCSQISSRLGNGDGTFQAPGHPMSAFTLSALADVNHDGKLDLIARSPGAVQIVLGDGNGGFSHSNAYLGPGGDGLAPTPITLVGDFNGDGNPDLVSGPYIYLGNGDGTFQGAPVLLPNSNPISAMSADVNGDGKPDIVAIAMEPAWCSEATYGLNVLLGDGKGEFALAETYDLSGLAGQPSAITSADLNGDGKPDLVISLSGTTWGIAALLSNGDGSFGEPIVTSVGNSESSQTPVMALADFNGDHKSDVALSGVDDNVYLLISNGDGTFATSQIDLGVPARPVAAGDFNGDGKIDLAVGLSGALAVLLGNGDGTFQQSITSCAGGVSQSSAVGDFNGDGRVDLVFGWSTFIGAPSFTVNTCLGNGDGTFQSVMSSYPVGTLHVELDIPYLLGGATMQAGADFDRDGRLDLIGRVNSAVPYWKDYFLQIAFGLGDGTFNFEPTPRSGSPLLITDFNQDMRPDIVTTNDMGIGMEVFLNTTYGGSTLSIKPNSIDFGVQALGSTSPASVVLKNTGSNPAVVTEIDAVTNANGAKAFSASQNCVTSIAPGNSCTLTVTFTPTDIGSVTGKVTIYDHTALTWLTITLAGSTPPELMLSISPASVDFGVQALGSTGSASVVLTNTGIDPAIVTSVETLTSTGGQAVFSTSQSCVTNIAPGGTCTLDITFIPTAIGSASGIVTISDNTLASPHVVTLAGTGAGVGLAVKGSNSATVAAGGTATYSLSLGGAGWSGQASISCTGLPKGASCTATGPVSLSATQASSVTLNVTTTSRTLATLTPGQAMRWPWIWAFLALGVTAFPRRILTKRYARYCLAVLACVLLVTLVCSCGSGKSSGATQQQNPNGTPAGTYQLVVTATSSLMNQSVNLTLNVQ